MKIRAICIFLSLYYITNIAYGTITTIDSIAAFVNNNIILDSDVRKNMNIQQYDIPVIHQHPTEKLSAYQEILHQLIVKDLIFNFAAQENISIKNKKIDQVINDILRLRNMTLHQFQIYLQSIGLHYTQYRTQLIQDMTNNAICNHIVQQRANISLNEINEIVQILNTVNYNIEFKTIHITIPLPIQPTQHQITEKKNIAESFIKNDIMHDNIIALANAYNSKHHIFQTIKIQKTAWTSWENMPIIFDQYLQNKKTGDIIGPIHAYDGIHLLKIQNTRYKKFLFPITRVKTKMLTLKTPSNNHDVTIKKLLKIKKYVENGDTTFHLIIKEEPHNTLHTLYYKEHLQWTNLDKFTPEIKKTLIKLKKNEISAPIYTPFGWCLIQLIDTNNINYSTMIRERAYYHLLYKKFNIIINNWIKELKSTSYIKIINPNEQ